MHNKYLKYECNILKDYYIHRIKCSLVIGKGKLIKITVLDYFLKYSCAYLREKKILI